MGFEGEIKMAGILQTVMDNFFSAIPEKQFEGFGSEPVAKKEKKTGLGTKPDSIYRDAYEEMEPVKDETSVVDKLANIFSDIVREENKDPETGTDRASKVSNTVSYTKGVTTVADLESQGHYVDKILRDNARDTSGKLGSNAAPINRKQNHFDVIRRAIEKHDKDTTFQDARPYRSSRGVDALEGPEASGPITGPVRAGEKELTSLQTYRKRLAENQRFGGGLDPEGLASPRRTPRSSRDVYALEGPEALGERGLGARPDTMSAPKADEMQIRAEDRARILKTISSPKADEVKIIQAEDFYLKIGKVAESDHGSTPVLTADAAEAGLLDNEKSMDVGFGHKIHKGGTEDTSGMIHGIKYKKADGTYIALTEEQKVKILNKDMAKNLNIARKDNANKTKSNGKGWDSKLKDIGTSWDKLDIKYQNVLTSLAYNVGGTKAGDDWTAVLQAAKDENILDFASELRRQSAGEYIKGLDNRVIRELYAAGIIDYFDDVSSVLPLASYSSLSGDGIPRNEGLRFSGIDPLRLANP